MLLSVQRVRKTFGSWVALDDVSLEIPAAGITGIIGPNGSGKSTLLGVVSRHIAPDAGQILLDGTDITRLSRSSLPSRGLVRLFQFPKLCSSITVFDNLRVAHVGRSKGMPGSDVEAALHRAGIDQGSFQKSPSELNHFERRCVELARAFLDAPRLVLADEPTSGLSETEASLIERLLVQLPDLGAAVLLVEHNLRLVRDLCSNVIVLEAGRVAATGSPTSPTVAREIGATFGA